MPKRTFHEMCDYNYDYNYDADTEQPLEPKHTDPVETLTQELQEVRIEYHKVWQETSNLRKYVEKLEKELQLYREEEAISRYIR